MNQPKTQKNLQTKPSVGASAPSPSAGALRAARHFIALGLLTTPIHAAEIIDRETGIAELLATAKQVMAELSDEEVPDADTVERLEQAIAKVEQGE